MFLHDCCPYISRMYSSNNTNSTNMHDVIYNVQLTLNKLIIYGKSWRHLQTEAPLFSNSLFTAGQKCTRLFERSKSAVMGQYCSLRWQWKQKQSKTQSEPVIHNHVAGFWSSEWQFAVNSPQKKSNSHCLQIRDTMQISKATYHVKRGGDHPPHNRYSKWLNATLPLLCKSGLYFHISSRFGSNKDGLTEYL